MIFTAETKFSVRAGGGLGPNAFVLQWCELQPFQATVKEGSLRVEPTPGKDLALPETAADLASPGDGLRALAQTGGCARAQ